MEVGNGQWKVKFDISALKDAAYTAHWGKTDPSGPDSDENIHNLALDDVSMDGHTAALGEKTYTIVNKRNEQPWEDANRFWGNIGLRIDNPQKIEQTYADLTTENGRVYVLFHGTYSNYTKEELEAIQWLASGQENPDAGGHATGENGGWAHVQFSGTILVDEEAHTWTLKCDITDVPANRYTTHFSMSGTTEGDFKKPMKDTWTAEIANSKQYVLLSYANGDSAHYWNCYAIEITEEITTDSHIYVNDVTVEADADAGKAYYVVSVKADGHSKDELKANLSYGGSAGEYKAEKVEEIEGGFKVYFDVTNAPQSHGGEWVWSHLYYNGETYDGGDGNINAGVDGDHAELGELKFSIKKDSSSYYIAVLVTSHYRYANGLCTACSKVCDHSGESETCSKCGATLTSAHFDAPADGTDIYAFDHPLTKGGRLMAYGSQESEMQEARHTVQWELTNGYRGRLDNYGWTLDASVFKEWIGQTENMSLSNSTLIEVRDANGKTVEADWFLAYKAIAAKCNWLIDVTWTKDDVIDVRCVLTNTSDSGDYKGNTFTIVYAIKLVDTSKDSFSFRITTDGSPTINFSGHWEGAYATAHAHNYVCGLCSLCGAVQTPSDVHGSTDHVETWAAGTFNANEWSYDTFKKGSSLVLYGTQTKAEATDQYYSILAEVNTGDHATSATLRTDNYGWYFDNASNTHLVNAKFVELKDKNGNYIGLDWGIVQQIETACDFRVEFDWTKGSDMLIKISLTATGDNAYKGMTLTQTYTVELGTAEQAKVGIGAENAAGEVVCYVANYVA